MLHEFFSQFNGSVYKRELMVFLKRHRSELGVRKVLHVKAKELGGRENRTTYKFGRGDRHVTLVQLEWEYRRFLERNGVRTRRVS